MKNNLGDSLAQSMNQVLDSPEHKNIFAKPKTISKKASNNIQDAFNALLDVSAKLDELGLNESASETLKAAHNLAVEAGLVKNADLGEEESEKMLDQALEKLHQRNERVDQEWEENDDLAGLLKELEESNDVMDVPNDTDMPEGLETTT